MKLTKLFGAALLVSTMLAAGAANAKSLAYCSEGSPGNFTPALNSTGTSLDAARPVFNQLVEFERGSSNQLVASLAESWEIAPDGLSITFKLRPGVKFHSGVNGFTPTRDFNADDVLWSFERQWKAEHPYNKVGASYDYFTDMMPSVLKTIEKVDDLTVKMTLSAQNAPFLVNLAMDFGSIHSAEYAQFMMDKGTPEQFDQVPVGTGPFMFVNYQKDAVIRYKAFDAYWGGKAKIDDLIFVITKDPTARYAKLKAEECQVMIAPNPADLEAMSKDESITVLQKPGLNIGYLAMNALKPPFDKVEVRQAINMAIDRDSILKEVYQGSAEKAKNPLPPIMWSYDEATVDYEYNPEKAKELLKAAGVETFETDLWWMPVSRPYNPNAKRMAEMMQADLAKVGITAKLVSYEWEEYRNRLKAGEPQMALYGWTGDNGDPDNFFFLLACNADGTPNSNNVAKWCNKEFDDKLAQAVKLSEKPDREKIYKEMQAIFKKEAPWVTLAHAIVFEPVSKKVVDYKVSPLGRHEFYGVDVTE